MPLLIILSSKGERHIPFVPGGSLLEILNKSDVKVCCGCGGIGSCGVRLARIEAGDVNPPTASERRFLSNEQILQGFRLACQVRPHDDVRVSVSPPPDPAWKKLSGGTDDVLLSRFFSPSPLIPGNEKSYGVAVDLGTTHIRVSLWDLKNGTRLAGRIGLNVQCSFGSDVMSRLAVARESPERAGEICRLARNAIGEALQDISANEGYSLAEIGKVVIAGNSAMLSLLSGKNYEQLLNPQFWASEIDCRPGETGSWCASWGLDLQTRVEVLQPLGGFVGSDLLAGVLATRLTERPNAALLIDFGTNSEIALWNGATLSVTSAAGGPAFEGCGISCGMPSEPGAIYRVEHRAPSPLFHCEVIGGGKALGVCGSGLVDVIAALVRTGMLRRTGRFAKDVGSGGIAIMEGRGDLVVTGRDIDMFQRAKAAIGAGIRSLLKRDGILPSELERICVCGAFGRFLHVHNAQEIGLLPTVSSDRVELCENGSLLGCECLLFSPDSAGSMEELKRKSMVFNLAQDPGFEALFIEELYLRPLLMD